ncbi:type VI secretion system baseplate subunit TssK [Iodobacter sp. CM08]|uniref:type VI secretion system baseplate subunit TssK n=1 Tax=Iodobacter sp. CM08 TaxID=3085902 RepID=UPI002981F67B|nr:type VI secretion system baseplate subunit TssK [Iodobacter sp. CM08]MDW5418504.1 type VI secretion system baseplate subunit TssK [Iodobacter sp. CM08]
MGQIPEAICWFEGMQLLPQHFQQQSLRAETLAAQYALTAQPYFWGVLNLEIDEAALISGKLRVLALEAILPDGLWVCLQPGVHPPLELDLKAPIMAEPNRLATFYIVVPPLYRAGELDRSGRRYRSVLGKDIPDLVSKESPASLTLLQPNLTLASEQQCADGVCLPLLRVEEVAGGFAKVLYFAPQPRVWPESLLGMQIANLCKNIGEKCVFLAGRLRLAQQANNEGDMARLNRQLAALWARLPELKSVLDSRVAHPSALYQILCGAAGSVCGLNPIAGVPAFRAFNYQELLGCFEEVIGFISQAIAQIRVGYARYPFKHEGTDFMIMPPATLKDSGQWVMGLRMPNGMAEEAAGLWLKNAVIASLSLVETLQKQRMQGVAYRQLDRQEQASYSVGEDTRLFMLYEFSGWIKPDELLYIAAASNDAGPLSIELFAPEADDIPVLSEAKNG